jgi:hypothetical protein
MPEQSTDTVDLTPLAEANLAASRRVLGAVLDLDPLAAMGALGSVMTSIIQHACPEPRARLQMLNDLLAPTIAEWLGAQAAAEGAGATRQ